MEIFEFQQGVVPLNRNDESLGDEVFSQGWSPRSNATLQLAMLYLHLSSFFPVGCEPKTWRFFFLDLNPTIETLVPWNF